MLQGVISFHDEAIPTCGFFQSSSVRPTARNIARDAAFWMPSVTSRERGLMSTLVSVVSVMITRVVAPMAHDPGAATTTPVPTAASRDRPSATTTVASVSDVSAER